VKETRERFNQRSRALYIDYMCLWRNIQIYSFKRLKHVTCDIHSQIKKKHPSCMHAFQCLMRFKINKTTIICIIMFNHMSIRIKIGFMSDNHPGQYWVLTLLSCLTKKTKNSKANNGNKGNKTRTRRSDIKTFY
jgi:hypothetical protein